MIFSEQLINEAVNRIAHRKRVAEIIIKNLPYNPLTDMIGTASFEAVMIAMEEYHREMCKEEGKQ